MDGQETKGDILVECCRTNTIKSGVEEDMLPINDLAESLLINILIRLRAKNAYRCKSVCKRWNLLISSPRFISHFIRRNHPPPSSSLPPQTTLLPPCIVQHLDKEDNTFSDKDELFKRREFILGFLPDFRLEPRVVGSSGGLLLCSGDLFSDVRASYSHYYFVCNPVTMKWVQLPPPPRWLKPDGAHIGFICEPFSNDNNNNEDESVINSRYRFIVARIAVTRGGRYRFPMEIFSSETGKWSVTTVSSPKALYFDPPLMNPVVYNGILHFLIPSPSNVIFAYNPFDHGTHDRFRFIDLPMDCAMHLGISGECLTLFQDQIEYEVVWKVYKLESEMFWKFWKLEDYNSGIIGEPQRIGYPNSPGFEPGSNICHRPMYVLEIFGSLYVVHGPEFTAFPFELPCWPTPVPTFPGNVLPS